MNKTKNGISPKYWGKSLWIFLNSIAFVYEPKLQYEEFKTFFTNLGNILPCDKCSSHYNNFLSDLEYGLESKTNLIEWLLKIRNDINAKSNKKILTYCDILEELYFPNTCENNTNNINNMNSSCLICCLFSVIIEV